MGYFTNKYLTLKTGRGQDDLSQSNLSKGERSMTQDVRSIDYGSASIRDFQVLETDDKSGRVTVMEVDGRPVSPSDRFWTSLCSTYSTHGLTTKLFKLFSHAEVFDRVHTVLGGAGADRLRYAIENRGEQGTLLAVTNPGKPVVTYEGINQTLKDYAAVGTEYSMGIMRSTHTPAHMDDFDIGPDSFSHRYVMETPIDGFGKPLIYLSLLRMICSNGSIGYARAFKSEVSLGQGSDEPIFTLERALDSFSNEEGFAALRQRFEKSVESWASIAETQKVYATLRKMMDRNMFKDPASHKGRVEELFAQRSTVLGGGVNLNLGEKDGASTMDSPVNIKVMRAFSELVGDIVHIYSLTHMDALSRKKQAQLSSRATMYELLNFCTELATHFCNEANGRLLQAEVGNFVSNEYDLEGTKEAKPTFQDWFTDAEAGNPENN